jgi:hypothetical protein
MVFVRFVIRDLDGDSGRRQGLFQALADLDDRGDEDEHQAVAEPFGDAGA